MTSNQKQAAKEKESILPQQAAFKINYSDRLGRRKKRKKKMTTTAESGDTDTHRPGDIRLICIVILTITLNKAKSRGSTSQKHI